MANARDSPLLRLPIEIRNRIFEYVFDPVGYRPYYTALGMYDPPRPRGLRKRMLIPTTCRQLYAETAVLPLQTVTLEFRYTAQVVIWTDEAPAHIKPAVKEICIDTIYEARNWFGCTFDRLLDVCKTLENLECVYLCICEEFALYG